MYKALSLEGKVAIVTGGAGGIGQATIDLMIGRGARVAIADIALERAQAVAARYGDAAIAIGYLPGQLMRRDPRAEKLTEQLEALRVEARELAGVNAALYREVNALRTDVGAIEDRARGDLGMVYPDEVVLRVRRDEAAEVAP